jgi:hypothetical protein
MHKKLKHVLKSDEVELQGSCRLNTGHTKPSLSKDVRPTQAIQQVRIVESHPEFAIIEVTCCCGEKTFLKCEYADNEISNESSTSVSQ